MGASSNADYFSVKATLMHIRKQNNLYKACPSGSCKKKVTDDGTGKFHCEKCMKDFPNFEWRLMMSASFSDCTGQAWFTCFQVGLSAQPRTFPFVERPRFPEVHPSLA